MTAFRIHQSNRLERLADLLAELCREPSGGPLDPEAIVVPNPGMARWLSLRLADRLGVCANVTFPLPATFTWDVWSATLPSVAAEPAFSVSELTWRIFALLDHVATEPVFRPLASYLKDDDDLRRFELAEHIAEVFDQYLVYRPEMIVAWEEGQTYYPPETRDESWQAELWRRVGGDTKPRHRARLALEFERVSLRRLAAADLPPRVLVFGIPALARMHIATLRRLSEVRPVDVFVVNPCRMFWEDILPPSDIARLAGETDPADLFLETGNPLLASLGRQGRDFVSMLELGETEGTESFVDPLDQAEPARMLDILQGDILDLRTRGDAPGEDAPVPVPPGDASVQIHACHSAMREVEVLHDRLLDLFASRPELEPSQVRVMTPDIEAYAPMIDAVFGTATGRREIPYAIADRPPRAERSTIAAFLALLELPAARFDATSLLALLETPAVRTRFGIPEAELPRVAQWLRTSGIRWGIDAAHRAQLGLPAMDENTWRFGLDRLMLGHAMAGRGRRMFDGILPVDDVEGADAVLMGRLHAFAEEVFGCSRHLTDPRTAAEWRDVLIDVLDRFFAGSEAEEDVETLRGTIRRFSEEAERAGCVEPLSSRLVVHELDRLLRQPGGAWAFLSGAVTFCTMVPMRNIPAAVVCLLGMNEQTYPRSRRPPGFDLMPRHPQKGDRWRTDDDRYLFLEALLSARDTFYVSYVGRDIRDNTEASPSILVSELRDVIGPDAPRTEHPLQAFSPRYFSSQPDLFSYDDDLRDAAETARRAGVDPPQRVGAFVPHPLSEPSEEWRTVRLDALLRFFRDPTKYFVKNRLGVLVDPSEGLVETSEPFDLQKLGRYEVQQRLLELTLSGRAGDEILALVRATGLLPLGHVGENAIEGLHAGAARISERIAPWLDQETLAPQSVDLAFGDLRLVGSVSGLTPHGLLRFGFGDINGREHLQLWVRHLALNLLAPSGVEPVSRHVTDQGTLTLRPVEDARPLLEDLVRLYWEGLHRPIPLFPDTSIKTAKGARTELNVEKLVTEWNVYPEIAYRGDNRPSEEFAAIARRVFDPLLAAAERSP